jgi:hypothetical protein
LAAILAIAAHGQIILVLTLFIFALILVRCYYRTIRYSFTGSRFIAIQTNVIAKLERRKEPLPNMRLDEQLKSDTLVTYTSVQLDQFKNTLGACIAFNNLLHYWAYHLDQYRQGPLPYLFSMFTYVWLFLVTIVTLAFSDIAVLHLSATSFSYVAPPSSLTMFHFALASLALGTIPQVEASSNLAQFMQILAGVLGPVMGIAVIGNLLFTTRQFREAGALQAAISDLANERARLRELVQNDYQTSLEDALVRLKALGTNLYVWIADFLSKELPDDFS